MKTSVLASVAAVAAMLASAAGSAMALPALPGARAGLPDSALQTIQYRRRCVAVGVTVGGRLIPGVRGAGYGRDACLEALRECNFDLRQRQRVGANPLGRCVVR